MGAVMQDRVARYVALIESPDTLDVLCQRVADGEGLPALCASWDVPYGRVLTWLMADVKRYTVYQNALAADAHRRVVLARDVADAGPVPGEDVGRDKLRVDTAYREAKYHAPALYGEKEGGGGGIVVIVNRGGSDPAPVAAAVSDSGRTLTIL